MVRGRRNIYLHLFVHRSHWLWGYDEMWYDGPHPTWGFGPFFLLTRSWAPE